MSTLPSSQGPKDKHAGSRFSFRKRRPSLVAFYTATLAPLGLTTRVDYDGSNGPPDHPDLKGFGAKGRIFFWLRQGSADSRAAHVGFVANSRRSGCRLCSSHRRGSSRQRSTRIRLYYDPRYYAANVLDPDGYSLEFVYKSWQTLTIVSFLKPEFQALRKPSTASHNHVVPLDRCNPPQRSAPGPGAPCQTTRPSSSTPTPPSTTATSTQLSPS